MSTNQQDTAAGVNAAVAPAEAVARALHRRRGAVAACGALGLALGWAAVAVRPPAYRAAASIEVIGVNESFLGGEETTPTPPDARLPLRSGMATQVRVLNSRSLQDAALDLLLSTELGATHPAWQADVLDAAESFQARASDDSRVLDVSATGPSGPAVAAFVNTLAEEFLRRDRRQRLNQASETGEWLDAQLRVLAERARRSDRRLAAQTAHGGDAEGDPGALGSLRRELAEARSERMRLQSTEDLPGVAGESALLRDYRGRLSRLVAEKAKLDALYLPEHYKVRQAAAEIEGLREEIAGEQQRRSREAQAGFIAALRRERMLTEEVSRQEKEAAARRRQAVSYETLRREATANRELYEGFLRQVNAAGVGAAVPTSAVRILDRAGVPTESIGPSRRAGGLMGMLAGLFLGGLWAVSRERLDVSLKRPGDARRALDLRELGAIPDAAFEYEEDRMTPAGLPAKARPPAERACGAGEPTWLAECVRGVRTSLLLGSDSPQVLLVTSPTPGEGKTTVAANLAQSLSELGRRTLLVDADLRLPRLDQVFSVPNSLGLVDLLREPGESIQRYVREVGDGLWLLPAGVASFGGPGLLQERAFEELLPKLRAKFDLIVIDSPPVLVVSDARALARAADGTVLVVRAGKTQPADAADAKRVLESDGANLLGVVLNSWNPKVYGPRRYERYGEHYRRSTAA